jgi:outer membrane protein assembly factor BamD (BamD/ComL family)
MPKYMLTMSAKKDGVILTNSFGFEAKTHFSEDMLIDDFRQFYPGHEDIRVISYIEIASDFRMKPLIDNSPILSKLAYA